MSDENEDEARLKRIMSTEISDEEFRKRVREEFQFHTDTTLWITTGQVPGPERAFWRRIRPVDKDE